MPAKCRQPAVGVAMPVLLFRTLSSGFSWRRAMPLWIAHISALAALYPDQRLSDHDALVGRMRASALSVASPLHFPTFVLLGIPLISGIFGRDFASDRRICR